MSDVTPVLEGIQVPVIVIDLPEEDGEPLESNWHRLEINLLVDLTIQLWPARDDFFAGGNMFIYYSAQQARTREYRGPDFFVVKEVAPRPDRRYWAVWEEDGRFPDVIVELLSPSTAAVDLSTKKRLYERTFRTPEYFAYDPDTRQLHGWRIGEHGYRALEPNEQGWLWSQELQVWLGGWEGEYERAHTIWLRFYDPDGRLTPTGEEAQAAARRRAEQRAEQAQVRAEQAQVRAEQAQVRAEQAQARAEQAQARADQEAASRLKAEAEIAQLRAELTHLRGD